MLDHNNKYAIITDQIDQKLRVACKQIKEEGYRYVELHNVFGKSIEECSEAECNVIKEILEEYQLEVVNIASTVFFLCPLFENYQVSLFNEEFHAIKGDVKYHLAMLHNACKIAKKLNCKTIRIFPFRYPDNEDIVIVGTKQDQKVIVENFKKAVKIAKFYDVTLVVENCPYSHCPKGEMTLDLIKAVNDEHLKLLWDPANSYRAEKHKVPKEYIGRSLIEEYELIKEEIAHVHLKNYEYDASQKKPFVHKSLLDGDIDYIHLIEAMKVDTNYLSLEPEVDYDKSIQSMRDLKKILENQYKILENQYKI